MKLAPPAAVNALLALGGARALACVIAAAWALAAAAPAAAQRNVKAYKRNGIDYYEAGRYANAAEALLVYRRYEPQDEDIWYPLAVSHYKLNQLGEARTLLEGALRAGKAPKEAHLYLGRIAHHEAQFAEAATAYKRFLAKAGDGHPLYASIVDDIRRAGYGARLGPNSGAVSAYSENLGPGINSSGDDFRPVLSPNYGDRMYFSSIRDGVTGGYRDARGMADPENGTLRSDMYATQVDNGRWAGAEPLSYLLNSSEHDVALDFAGGGQVLVFFRGKTDFAGDVHLDTFRRNPEERNLTTPTWREGPLRAHEGDNDLYLYNDTIALFASRRDGGYGGFDLYASVRRGAAWQPARNLGPEVNGPYDERSPFLAQDGRALYFSSNRVGGSVGGFDVLRARYDDRAVAWGRPENLGLSVNSGGDELNFRLAANGLEGYFDSDARTTSLGGRDIYAAYFKEELREQTTLSRPVTFLQVEAAARREALAGVDPAAGAPGGEGPAAALIPVSVRLQPLPYGSDDNVLTPGNLEKSRPVVQFLERYPGARVVVTAHSDDSDPERFRAYFGIKRAERFAEYLIGRGVGADRIQLVSVGSAYPLAANSYNDQVSVQGQRFNRRLELHVVPGPEYALDRDYDDPRVPDFIAEDRARRYRKLQDGLTFRVEVARLGQIYDEVGWLRLPVPTIYTEPGLGEYVYGAGAYNSYRSADQLAREFARKGFSDARVVAYLNGLRLSDGEVATFASEYPELASLASARAAAAPGGGE